MTQNTTLVLVCKKIKF